MPKILSESVLVSSDDAVELVAFLRLPTVSTPSSTNFVDKKQCSVVVKLT